MLRQGVQGVLVEVHPLVQPHGGAQQDGGGAVVGVEAVPEAVRPRPELLHILRPQGVQDLLPAVPLRGLRQHGQGEPQGDGGVHPVPLPRQGQGGALRGEVREGGAQAGLLVQAGGLVPELPPRLPAGVVVIVELLPGVIIASGGLRRDVGQVWIGGLGQGIGGGGGGPAASQAWEAVHQQHRRQHGGNPCRNCRPQGAAVFPGPRPSCRLSHRPLHRRGGGMQGPIGPLICVHQGSSSPFSAAASFTRPRDSQLLTVPSLAPMRAATSATE